MFINTNYDAEDVFKIIKRIAEYYDKMTESSWSEDIMVYHKEKLLAQPKHKSDL